MAFGRKTKKEMNMSGFPSVGHVAFASSLTFAAATVGAGVAMTGVTSTVAVVALAIFALSTAGAGIAAGTAYFATEDKDDLNEYYENFKKHAAVVIGAEAQLAAQAVVSAIIQAIKDAVYDAIMRAFNRDHKAQTVRVR